MEVAARILIISISISFPELVNPFLDGVNQGPEFILVQLVEEVHLDISF